MAAAPFAPPPAGVTIVGDNGPPKPPPAPTTTIRVSQMPTTATPAEPAKRGSAMQRLQTDLRKKAGIAEGSPTSSEPTPTTAPTPQKPSGSSPAPEGSPGNQAGSGTPPVPEPAPSPAPEPAPAPAPQPAQPKGKTNPWKLVDDFKARAAKAEADLLELRKGILPEQDRVAFAERVTKAEARTKELEDEIRHVNYEKSAEYIEKYQKPYEEAWQRVNQELAEVAVMDPVTKQPRPATAQDMLELVNLPLGEAMQSAEEKFGNLGEYMMTHRNQIRTLWDAQRRAVAEAKKNGALREQQQHESLTREANDRTKTIRETWEKVNAAALEDPKLSQFFKPREGNQEWNQRLSKGFELVDRAYAENALDPKLTHDQRMAVVQRHAAVRNRAASWGALRWENEQLRSELDSIKKELAGYKGSTPPAGGSAPSSAPAQPGTAWERLRGELYKKAGL